jgi:hypothetical protein
MMLHARALTRFWWVVILGIVVAVVAMLFVYRSAERSHVAVGQLLVTSREAPYFTTTVREVETTTSPRADTTPDRGNVPLSITAGPPDVNTLVRAANMYPFLIESDLVTQQRDKMFGPLPGTVSSRALFAILTPVRFDPSDIPIIEIVGQAEKPGQAVRLTQATAAAFMRFIKLEQDNANLRRGDRIVIREIQRPTATIPVGGPSTGLVAMIGAAVLLAFGALAILLDRTFPRKRDEGDVVSPVPAVGVNVLATEPPGSERKWA